MTQLQRDVIPGKGGVGRILRKGKEENYNQMQLLRARHTDERRQDIIV